MLRVKKDDEVLILAGKDQGKKGRVLRVFPVKQRAVVENMNLLKKHTRPNPQKNIKGGVVERESHIHLANLMVICRECGKPSRIGYSQLSDGKKVRVCKKCNGTIDK
jgi:large subunit ribosomal protein L24